MLYAQDRWALLLVFQAMDAAGKDSTIKHVMSGVNPQGCQVFSFKEPRARSSITTSCGATPAPARARAIGIFNRSLLRGSAGRARAPGVLAAEAPAAARRQGDLGRAVRGHRALRAPPRPQRHVVLKFFLHVSEGAEEAVPRAPRRAGEELEVLGGRRAGARVLGRLHGGVRGRDPATATRTRRGSSCRPTTSGSRGSSSPGRSSTRWRASTSPTRGRRGEGRRSSRPRGRRCRASGSGRLCLNRLFDLNGEANGR